MLVQYKESRTALQGRPRSEVTTKADVIMTLFEATVFPNNLFDASFPFVGSPCYVFSRYGIGGSNRMCVCVCVCVCVCNKGSVFV